VVRRGGHRRDHRVRLARVTNGRGRC
jgi:hypothetical protein